MLEISRIGCNTLSLKSQAITNLIAAPSDYYRVAINLYKNCCTTPTHIESNTLSLTNGYYTLLPKVNLQVKGIVIRNVAIGLDVSISMNVSITTSTDFDTVETAINNYLSSSGIGGTIVITPSTQATTYSLEYAGLPVGWQFVSIEYNVGLGSQYSYFQSYFATGVIITSDSILINSEVLSVDNFEDAIYSVELIIIDGHRNTITEKNCYFFDCITKCQVASKLNEFITDTEETTTIHMLHYGLINGSNCGCECNELCNLFEYLQKLLGINITTSDCGC